MRSKINLLPTLNQNKYPLCDLHQIKTRIEQLHMCEWNVKFESYFKNFLNISIFQRLLYGSEYGFQLSDTYDYPDIEYQNIEISGYPNNFKKIIKNNSQLSLFHF